MFRTWIARRCLSASAREYAETIYRRSTGSDLKLIKGTLKLMLTAVPEARRLVIVRASPHLASQVSWFGNWIVNVLTGKDASFAAVRNKSQKRQVVLDGQLLKARLYFTQLLATDLAKKWSSIIAHRPIQEVMVGLHQFQTFSCDADTPLAVYSEEGASKEISKLLCSLLPDSVLSTFTEKLLPSSTSPFVLDEYLETLFNALDTHKHVMRVILAFIGIQEIKSVRTKLAKAKVAFDRNMEDLESSIDVFLSKAPVWKKEDDAFMLQIQAIFDENKAKPKVINTEMKPALAPRKVGKNNFLSIKIRCFQKNLDPLERAIGSTGDALPMSTTAVVDDTTELNGYFEADDGDKQSTVLPSTIPDEDPSNKILIAHIPKELTSLELSFALRNCGYVGDIWMAQLDLSPAVEKPPVMVKVEDEDEDVVESEVAVALVSETGRRKKKSKKATHRQIMMAIHESRKSDCYAFVRMRDMTGYLNATADDMRVFGICLKKKICRIHSAHKFRTLYITLWETVSTMESINLIASILEDSFELKHSCEPDLRKPYFIHLTFDTHADAWRAYDRLQKNEYRGSLFSVDWIKTSVYSNTVKRLRDYTLGRGFIDEDEYSDSSVDTPAVNDDVVANIGGVKETQ